MKFLKVLFLLDKSNLWIEKYLINYKFKTKKKKYKFKISKKPTIKFKPDIIFLMNFTKKVSNNFLEKYPNTFLVHESKLPKDKGFAPVAYQILRGQKRIFMSLIKVTNNLDGGDIFETGSFKLKGYELNNEIRYIQAISKLKLINKFLNKFPKVKFIKQKSNGNFNKKMTKNSSQLDVNKTIKQQFSKLRIVSNESYPAFFFLKKKKYILKIFRKKI